MGVFCAETVSGNFLTPHLMLRATHFVNINEFSCYIWIWNMHSLNMLVIYIYIYIYIYLYIYIYTYIYMNQEVGKPNNYRFNCSMIKFICSWKLYNFQHGLLQLNWHWHCCWIIIQVCVLSPLVRLSSSYLQYWTYHFKHGSIKIIGRPRYFTWWRHQMETFPRYWPFVRRIHRSSVNTAFTKASDAELWYFLWSVRE